MVVKVLWEQNSRHVNNKLCVPRNVVHISANITPSEIKLDGANESKVKFVASGSKPLHHATKLKLTDEMEKAATELHKYLPVLAGIGIKSVIPRITDEELLAFNGILKVEGDEREGSLFYSVLNVLPFVYWIFNYLHKTTHFYPV